MTHIKRTATIATALIALSLPLITTTNAHADALEATQATQVTLKQVPTIADTAHLDAQLSTWSVSNGTLHIGLTKLDPVTQAAFTAVSGVRTDFHQEEQYVSAVKVTQLNRLRTASSSPYAFKATPPDMPSNSQTADAPWAHPVLAGGMRITSIQNGGSTIVQCTSSKAWVYNSGTRFIALAGHCGPNGTTWNQTYWDTIQGAVGPNPLAAGTESNRRWANNDVDFAATSGSSSNISTEILETQPATGASSGVQYHSSTGAARVPVGGNVCTDGSFTGWNCEGVIQVNDLCANVVEGTETVHVCGLDKATSASSVIVQAGDSGGPVVTPVTVCGAPSDYYVATVGIISARNDAGKTVLFTDALEVGSRFGWQPYVAATLQ